MSIFQFTNEYNTRIPKHKDNGGSILRFNKHKGYESIPREFAQNEKLSYEARGLLISIASYPESFKLYKCELYRRSDKNSRRKIDRCWQELIEEGYIIQFRKRMGKKYLFSYLFSLEPFLSDEFLSMLEEALIYKFNFYHKDIYKASGQLVEKIQLVLPKFFTESEKTKIIHWIKNKEEFSNVQNKQSNKFDGADIFFDVQDEQSTVNCSKNTTNKLTSNRFTNEITDTKKYVRQIDTEEESLIHSLSVVMKESFLSIASLELIARHVHSLEEAKEFIDILYQSKKYVEDNLDGLKIVAEYGEIETHEMLQRYFFKRNTSKMSSEKGYLYNAARNHWLQMASLLVRQYNYPNSEKYLQKATELYEKLKTLNDSNS